MNLGWLAMWVGAPTLIAVAIIIVLTRRRPSRTVLTRLETWCIGLIGIGSALDPMTITAGGNASDPSYEGLMGWMLNLDLAPVGWALGLALVAAAFELGHRLQRDTEGLV